MKRLFLSLTILALSFAVFAQNQQQRLEENLYYLASDSLRGRLGGSDDARKAAEFIVKQYEAMGLQPFYSSGYLQPFTNNLLGMGRTYNNIVAWIPGSDPALRDEYIIIGAHYDHLGVKNGKVYNGADDNASGTVSIIEIARQLSQQKDKLKRSVIFINFDGEELGLLGSNYMAERLAKEKRIKKVCLMMSVDMVGWYKQSGKLILQGSGTINKGDKLLKDAAELLGVKLKLKRYETSVFTATDTQGFAEKGVPTLAVTTGVKSPYHKPEDDPELIDYQGLSTVTDYLSRLTLQVSNDEMFRSSGRVAKKHQVNPKGFEMGIDLDLGSSWLHAPRGSAMDGRSRFAFDAGLTFQYNFNWFALRLDAMYGWSLAKYPHSSDFYNRSKLYYQEAFTFPLWAVFQSKTKIGLIHADIGLYYSRLCKGGILHEHPSWGYVNRNQFGLNWALGVRLYGLDMSVFWRYQFNPIANSTATDVPNFRNYYAGLRLCWYFL
jgi:hypothetical protein